MAVIDVKLSASRVQLRLDRMPDEVRAMLGTTARMLDDALVARAKSLASGGVLKVRTGSYVASIRGSVRVSQRSVSGSATSRDRRAHIFEFGGETSPHLELPKIKQAMAFMMGAGKVFASMVHHPGSHIAEHSVIHAAFDEMKGDIQADLQAAVSRGVAAGA